MARRAPRSGRGAAAGRGVRAAVGHGRFLQATEHQYGGVSFVLVFGLVFIIVFGRFFFLLCRPGLRVVRSARSARASHDAEARAAFRGTVLYREVQATGKYLKKFTKQIKNPGKSPKNGRAPRAKRAAHAHFGDFPGLYFLVIFFRTIL